MTPHRLLPLLPLLFALTAHAAEDRQPYTCDNGSRLDISFAENAEGRPLATLHFADEAMVLPLVPSGSGALYRKGDIRLHTKGDEALFEDGKGNMRHCLRGNLPPGGNPVPAQQPGTSSFLEIGGSVTTLARIALPPDAVLTIRVLDTSRSDAPARVLVDQRYELNGAQLPIPFSATIDRDLIAKKARLSVSARIEQGGKLRFVSDKAYPPLKNGQPVPVDIVLKPVGRKPR
jgi:putative lipoprotein